MKIVIFLIICVAIVGIITGCGQETRVLDLNKPESPELDTQVDGVAVIHTRIDCPSETNCAGFVQLLFDGRLRVNRINEYPPVLRTATVTDAELGEIVEMSQAESVSKLFWPKECSIWGKEIVESFYMKSSWENGEAILCEATDIAIVEALYQLAEKYVGDLNGDMNSSAPN